MIQKTVRVHPNRAVSKKQEANQVRQVREKPGRHLMTLKLKRRKKIKKRTKRAVGAKATALLPAANRSAEISPANPDKEAVSGKVHQPGKENREAAKAPGKVPR